mgnify:CR=1 FL=1
MKPVPEILVRAFAATCERKAEPKALLGAYLGWLRFYLDFCFNYNEPPRDADSLHPFLQKLAAKNQSAEKQAQAARAVGLYYETMRVWAPEPVGKLETVDQRPKPGDGTRTPTTQQPAPSNRPASGWDRGGQSRILTLDKCPAGG